ncbi:MAG: EutN/CcmL family microcompartment protein [Spirochaetes bacterium]|nr:EutN/CcmL family microcompartment protein [Spirochaetota bacterium]
MVICKVIGHLWATKKEESLNGLKLMVVEQINHKEKSENKIFVAVDIVSAGIGEKVIVVTGSTARRALGKENTLIDAAIVGIIDSIEAQ